MGDKGGKGSEFKFRIDNGGQRWRLRRGEREERDGVAIKMIFLKINVGNLSRVAQDGF